jgi:membrane-associated protease RseP (regulator of RpoE activity)
MSRLDDELKRAFARTEPPGDFAASLLAKINERAAPRPALWQRLAALFEMPRARFVMATAALLIIIGAAIFSQMRESLPETPEQASSAAPGPEQVKSDSKAPQTGLQAGQTPTLARPEEEQRIKKIKPRRFVKGGALARRHVPKRAVEPEVSPEAEAAKARVLFALQIASSTLKEAQRVIQEDSQNTNTVPTRDR